MTDRNYPQMIFTVHETERMPMQTVPLLILSFKGGEVVTVPAGGIKLLTAAKLITQLVAKEGQHCLKS